MLFTAPGLLCLEPKWVSNCLVAGRVATLCAKAHAIYLEPEWVSNYRVAGRVAILRAKAPVIYRTGATLPWAGAICLGATLPRNYMPFTIPKQHCARKSCNSLTGVRKNCYLLLFGRTNYSRSHFRNHIPLALHSDGPYSALASTVHEHAWMDPH